MYFFLGNITNCMDTEQLREMVPPPSQNTVAVYSQITLLIPYYIISGLVTLLKITEAPVQVSHICDLAVSFKLINFSFEIFLSFFLKCLVTSRFILLRLTTVLCLGSCTHCILPCFLSSKKRKYSSSNRGLMLLQIVQT